MGRPAASSSTWQLIKVPGSEQPPLPDPVPLPWKESATRSKAVPPGEPPVPPVGDCSRSPNIRGAPPPPPLPEDELVEPIEKQGFGSHRLLHRLSGSSPA